MLKLIVGAVLAGGTGILSDYIRYYFSRKHQFHQYFLQLEDIILRLKSLKKGLNINANINCKAVEDIIEECLNFDKIKDQIIFIKNPQVRLQMRNIISEISHSSKTIISDHFRIVQHKEGYWDLDRKEPLKDTEISLSIEESIQNNVTKLEINIDHIIKIFEDIN